MNYKELDLKQITKIAREFISINHRIKMLRSRLEMIGAIDYAKDRIQGGIQEDRMEELIDLIREQELKMFERYTKLKEYEDVFYQRLAELKDSDYRIILEKRYIYGVTSFKLAEEMNRSRAQTFRLLGQARSEFYSEKDETT